MIGGNTKRGQVTPRYNFKFDMGRLKSMERTFEMASCEEKFLCYKKLPTSNTQTIFTTRMQT